MVAEHVSSPSKGAQLPQTAERRERIGGRYELLELIGAGGMGVVYRAHDIMFGRDVAVKLLKPDMPADGPAATRFRVEAQITGRLQHPGIPPAYELGTLPNGQPFLAMKLVKGQTLRQLLKDRKSPAEDLSRFIAIFEQVCHAVGYAHTHGVIHRDLKPTNVMVGAHGEVLVMDWGLAKVLEPHTSSSSRQESDPDATLTLRTEVSTPDVAESETRTGSILGTPAYMAPEQAAGEVRKLDARSDVFGLGAILCEILTGEPPYLGDEANPVRIQAIRWETAPAFARLDACVAEPELVALCKRCLAFKQEDRPADGREVAQQVAAIRQAAEARARQAELEQQRALVREAEQRKRRRLTLWAAVAVTVVLLAGLGVSLYQMQRALSAEALATNHAAEAVAERDAKAKALQAEEQARLLAEQKRQEAETNLGYARKANEILGSVFTGLDPRAEYETIAEFRGALTSNLKQAVEQLEGSAIGDPLVVAEMQNTLGLSLLGLGETHLAITLFERALTTRNAQLGPEHPDTLTSMNNLASAYMDAGRSDDALRLRKETLELFKARLGPEHPDTLISMNNLASAYQDAGRLDEALPLYEQTLELQKARVGPEHPNTLTSMNNLASAYRAAGRLDEALPLYQKTLELRKARLGPEHPDTLISMNNLAGAYQAAGRLDEALPLYQKTLELRKARLGPEHPDTLGSMNNLASAYRAVGRLDEALPLCEQAAAGMAKRGFRHEYAARIVQNTINAYEAARQLDRAEVWWRRWAAHVKETAGADSLPYAGELAGLGLNLLQQKKYSEAEAILRECLSIRKTQQPDAWTTFNIQSLLGEALLGQEKYADAEPLLRAAYEGLKARQKDIPQPWRVQLLVEAVDRLIALYTAVNRPDDVQTWQAEKERLTAPKD